MATITLTFDNGPEPGVTPKVLETLRRHSLRATFFVLGRKLATHRALAERAHSEGHWIGNHTYNHAVPLGLMAEKGAAADEIVRTEALIGDLAHENRLFRPYGGGGVLDKGLLNREARDHLAQQSYTIVLWNAIPGTGVIQRVGWRARSNSPLRRARRSLFCTIFPRARWTISTGSFALRRIAVPSFVRRFR